MVDQIIDLINFVRIRVTMRKNILIYLSLLFSSIYAPSIFTEINRNHYLREHQFWHTEQTRFPYFINYFYDLVKCGIKDIRITLNEMPSTISNLIIPPNPHVDDIALVRHTTSDELCKQELEFLDNRKEHIKKGIEQLFGEDIQMDYTPRIALCFSGGGFRSMLMTLGFLGAAKDIGLLDASTYITGLSGSTWAIAPWIASGKSLKHFTTDLINHIKYGLNHIDDLEELRLLLFNLLAKIHNKQCISAMDIYGAVLINTLLNDMGSNRLCVTLTESHKDIIKGALPLPIYTATQTNPDPYEWMEVTPFEVGSPFLEAYVPTWAYGRKFKNDVSIDQKPEQTLGYYLGIFGSAFEVNFEDILQRTTFNLTRIKNSLPEFLGGTVDKVVNTIINSPLNNFRLFPSMLRNFTHNAFYSPIREDKTICLIDAGIDFNLPIPPLLRKNRNVDIIIIYDASGNIENAPELRHAQEYAECKGIKFPSIDYSNINKNTVNVFKDENSDDTPIIIYFPRIKNPDFSQDFDPTFCVQNEYCNTFNFVYTENQINNLTGLASFTLKQHADVIKNIIKEVIERKQIVHA